MPTQKIQAQNKPIEDTALQDTSVTDTSVQNIKSPWHPAFCAAFHLELEPMQEHLHFHSEYCLGKEPMRIDLLIIKKDPDVQIPHNIGQIFRTHNVVSYKSPDDYLSINDFYKAYGYACFLQADTEKVCEIDPQEITITYVCYYYPKNLIDHIAKEKHIYAKEREPGIYDLKGASSVIQLIVTSRLSPDHNFWLSYLRKNVKSEEEMETLLEHYEANKDSPNCRAVIDRILRANLKWMKEENNKMLDAVYELFKDEIDARWKQGFASGEKRGFVNGEKLGFANGEKQGFTSGKAEGVKLTKTVFRLSSSGASTAEIAAQCNISEDYVKEILN